MGPCQGRVCRPATEFLSEAGSRVDAAAEVSRPRRKPCFLGKSGGTETPCITGGRR
jgi:hypothetical protein